MLWGKIISAWLDIIKKTSSETTDQTVTEIKLYKNRIWVVLLKEFLV